MVMLYSQLGLVSLVALSTLVIMMPLQVRNAFLFRCFVLFLQMTAT
jgi:hypothetical protein